MIWPVYATISIVTLSVANLLGRVLMREEDSNPISYAIFFQFGLALFSFILAVIFGRFELPQAGSSLFRFIISSFLWAGATVFGLWSVKKINAGESTIIGASSSIFTITLGILFLGEVLTPLMIVGILMVFASVLIVNSEKLSFGSKEGIIYALLMSVCSGVAIVNDAVILRTYEAFSYTTLMSLFPGILLLLFFPRHITKVGNLMNKKSLIIMCVFCLLYAVQAIAFYMAFEAKAPVSQLSPFAKSSIVLTVILAAIFLGERNNMKKKLLATLVVTVGVILLG